MIVNSMIQDAMMTGIFHDSRDGMNVHDQYSKTERHSYMATDSPVLPRIYCDHETKI